VIHHLPACHPDSIAPIKGQHHLMPPVVQECLGLIRQDRIIEQPLFNGH
jgi:hypothetical protein